MVDDQIVVAAPSFELYVIVYLSTETLSRAENVTCGASTVYGLSVFTLTFGTFGATVSTTYPLSVALFVFHDVSSAVMMRIPDVSTEMVQFTVVTHD